MKIQILEKDLGRHKDLIFEFLPLIEQKSFDTYYFSLAIEPSNDIKGAISSMLNEWIKTIREIIDRETIFLPIDISDQYIGCLKISKNEILSIQYGFIEINGFAINPFKPIAKLDALIEFKSENNRTIEVQHEDFIHQIEEAIETLKK